MPAVMRSTRPQACRASTVTVTPCIGSDSWQLSLYPSALSLRGLSLCVQPVSLYAEPMSLWQLSLLGPCLWAPQGRAVGSPLSDTGSAYSDTGSAYSDSEWWEEESLVELSACGAS